MSSLSAYHVAHAHDVHIDYEKHALLLSLSSPLCRIELPDQILSPFRARARVSDSDHDRFLALVALRRRVRSELNSCLPTYLGTYLHTLLVHVYVQVSASMHLLELEVCLFG